MSTLTARRGGPGQGDFGGPDGELSRTHDHLAVVRVRRPPAEKVADPAAFRLQDVGHVQQIPGRATQQGEFGEVRRKVQGFRRGNGVAALEHFDGPFRHGRHPPVRIPNRGSGAGLAAFQRQPVTQPS